MRHLQRQQVHTCTQGLMTVTPAASNGLVARGGTLNHGAP